MQSLLFPIPALLLLLFGGCSIIGVQRDASRDVPLNKPVAEVAEAQLLDVWIELFDPGKLPADRKDAGGLSMDIREAEAHFMPEHLRDTMERTGYWGAVRVVPEGTEGGEVLVRGTILASDGERLELGIIAQDATGREWFDEIYAAETGTEAYLASGQPGGEAFQPLYNRIANDLARFRGSLDRDEIRAIRRVAELRFAADIAPDAFAEYLGYDDDGRYTVSRLPAETDPMYRRVQAIRDRDFLLIDTLNGHFDNFHREMDKPYDDWRRARSEEAAALRAVEREALLRKLLGFAAIAGAIAIEATSDGSSRSSSVLRDTMILGGVYAIKTGFDKDSETTIHRDAIEELGDSFSAEARPLVVEVEGETHELTGSAEVQYAKWRGLLKRIYAAETGLAGSAD